jgi:hypothetical protein
MSNYFTTTVDSPSHKTLFCGRRNELSDIISWVSADKNVGIIGETKIGKTFLRFILRDVLTNSCGEYIDSMIDRTLASTITTMIPRIQRTAVVDLSLHTIRDGETFYLCFVDELVDQGLLSGPISAARLSARDLRRMLDTQVIPCIRAKKMRLLLLVDEFDVVTEYENMFEVLGLLKDLSADEDLFSFVFFGWRGILDRIRDKYRGHESSFVDCVEKRLYMKPLDSDASKLLTEPLSTHIRDLPESLDDCIFFLSGGRPYFIQSACDSIVHSKMVCRREWDIQTFAKEASEQFYRDSAARGIIETIWSAGFTGESELLAYVAHYPGSTGQSVASFFQKYKQFEVNDFIDRLVKYGLLEITGGKCHVRGRVLAEWGRARKENPVKTFSRNRIKDEYTEKNSFKYADWTPPESEEQFIAIICRLVDEFQHGIEQKRGARLLWLAGQPAPEENAQILFDLLTEQYGQLADIVIDREIETGRGPVDFKFARGYRFRAHLEVKRAISDKLAHGLEKQLPTYLCADRVKNGFYLIICYNDADVKRAEELKNEGENLARTLGINLRVFSVKAFRKTVSASKV